MMEAGGVTVTTVEVVAKVSLPEASVPETTTDEVVTTGVAS